jgi:hypothetical protein
MMNESRAKEKLGWACSDVVGVCRGVGQQRAVVLQIWDTPFHQQTAKGVSQNRRSPVGQAVNGLAEVAKGAGSALFPPVAVRERGLPGRRGALRAYQRSNLVRLWPLTPLCPPYPLGLRPGEGGLKRDFAAQPAGNEHSWFYRIHTLSTFSHQNDVKLERPVDAQREGHFNISRARWAGNEGEIAGGTKNLFTITFEQDGQCFPKTTHQLTFKDNRDVTRRQERSKPRTTGAMAQQQCTALGNRQLNPRQTDRDRFQFLQAGLSRLTANIGDSMSYAMGSQ